MPAAAVSRIVHGSYLDVVTIPEDDQLRQTGVMGLDLAVPAGASGTRYLDFMSQHKIKVSLDGKLLATSGTGISYTITCNVIEKDKVAVPGEVTVSKTISRSRQFSRENLVTTLVDVASQFVCKPRWKPNGMSVGVLDVYFIGPNTRDYIADHILVVEVTWTIGRQTFYGVDIQDICILGWSMDRVMTYTKTNGDTHQISPDPLTGWAGCEELALYQRHVLGIAPFSNA
jgi:hypothetical protein